MRPRGAGVAIELLVLAALVGFPTAVTRAESDAVLVEPGELTRRADLLNRVVAVDDRVARFQWHNDRESTVPDRPYDEIYLKRTPVVFRLPPRLRFETAPRATSVRIEGTLRREGNQWVCDVRALDLFTNDLDRLERAVAALDPRDPRDVERRKAWARWAESRARAFTDPKDKESGADPRDARLLERGRQIEVEALQIEAERPGTDPPRRWFELAHYARQRSLPEPEPSALAHRALAARLARAETVDDLQLLVRDIETFWPASAAPPAAGIDLDPWLAPYANDPATTYRIAPEPVQAALSHRLWADATQRLAERRLAAEPQRAVEIAQAAAAALRDRPEVGSRLLEQALREATRNLAALRQSEVIELARVYREMLHQPDAARDLLRRWLDDQRLHRLSPTDAEGRVLLAQQYDTLLDDRATTVSLLRDAWQIDPQSREVADAFRRFGFRKVSDQWVESPRIRSGSDADPDAAVDRSPAPDAAAAMKRAAMRGLTPQEVRVRLGGKPDQVLYAASHGQVIEQWIYRGADQDQYVNFLHTPGDPLPKVVAFYARPRSRLETPRRQ